MTNGSKRPGQMAVFAPATATNLSPLPAHVARQLAEADHIQKRIAEEVSMHPKPGPAKRVKYKKGAIFTVDSDEQLTAMIDATCRAVGKKKRGNKRIGRSALYGDLVKYFVLLKHHGVTLPKGGNLSLDACQHGLDSILREYGYLNPDQTDRALVNTKKRDELGHKLARVFDRVADAVENPPA